MGPIGRRLSLCGLALAEGAWREKLREHGFVPLSEDEQRVLDEIERQLRLEPPRLDPRTSRLTAEHDAATSTPLLGLGLVIALAVIVVGVLAGGFFGVLVAIAGFLAFTAGGVALVRNSRANMQSRIDALVARYQGPPSSGTDGR